MKIIKWCLYLSALIVCALPFIYNPDRSFIDIVSGDWQFFLIGTGFYACGYLVGRIW